MPKFCLVCLAQVESLTHKTKKVHKLYNISVNYRNSAQCFSFCSSSSFCNFLPHQRVKLLWASTGTAAVGILRSSQTAFSITRRNN